MELWRGVILLSSFLAAVLVFLYADLSPVVIVQHADGTAVCRDLFRAGRFVG